VGEWLIPGRITTGDLSQFLPQLVLVAADAPIAPIDASMDTQRRSATAFLSPFFKVKHSPFILIRIQFILTYR
jgi:hypothetical protein